MKKLTARRISLAVMSVQALLYLALAMIALAIDFAQVGGCIRSHNGTYMLIPFFPAVGIIVLGFRFEIMHFISMVLHFLATLLGALLLYNFITGGGGGYSGMPISLLLICGAVVIAAIVTLAPQILYIFLRSKYVKKGNDEQ